MIILKSDGNGFQPSRAAEFTPERLEKDSKKHGKTPRISFDPVFKHIKSVKVDWFG